jgi:rfaE bifunctional protein nucleotidyltransferase chain/domain
VTTNGCFDLLHPGHVRFLKTARAQGDLLIVGLNSDFSVRRLKGATRPLIPEADRAAMLMALRAVDHVVVFDELLPYELLALLRPHVHCKAGDYLAQNLPEAEVVRQGSGEVRILPLVGGYSTSRLIERAQANTHPSEMQPNAEEQVSRRLWVVEQLMDEANLLRQTAYALSHQIVELSEMVVQTLLNGGRLLVAGDAISKHFAQRLAETLQLLLGRNQGATQSIGQTRSFGGPAEQMAAQAQADDLLIVIAHDEDGQLCQRVILTGRARGCEVAVLLGAQTPGGLNATGLCLSVPDTRVDRLCLAHQSTMHLACELALRSLAEASTS